MGQCILIWGLLQKSRCHHLASGLPDRVDSLWPGRHLCGPEKDLIQDLSVWTLASGALGSSCLLPLAHCSRGHEDAWRVVAWCYDSCKNVERGASPGEPQWRRWPVAALEPVLRESRERGPRSHGSAGLAVCPLASQSALLVPRCWPGGPQSPGPEHSWRLSTGFLAS